MTLQTLNNAGRSILAAAIITLLLAACAQTSVVDNWKTDKPVNNKPAKVAVIAVLPDALMRKAVEIDIAKLLLEKGTPAVPASNLPGMSGGIRGEIDPDAAVELLKSENVDGIVVLFYSGGGKSEGYVRSDYWLEHIGTGPAVRRWRTPNAIRPCNRHPSCALQSRSLWPSLHRLERLAQESSFGERWA